MSMFFFLFQIANNASAAAAIRPRLAAMPDRTKGCKEALIDVSELGKIRRSADCEALNCEMFSFIYFCFNGRNLTRDSNDGLEIEISRNVLLEISLPWLFGPFLVIWGFYLRADNKMQRASL